VTVLVAPDSFKGTFPAIEVADAIAQGVEAGSVSARRLPVADGGEGTLAVLLRALGGRLEEVPARDPLGREVRSVLGLLDDGATAVVETAAAAGYTMVADHERDAEAATTAGVGDLIIAAVHRGATRILVTVGGSATTDGGAGAIAAISEAGGVGSAQLTVLCDVVTPFERAAAEFGPQKGASSETVERLSQRLDLLAREFVRDPRGRPMTGAAGGLSGGLWSAFDAELVSGGDFVLDAVSFDSHLSEAGAVICGEGRLDHTSFAGKILSIVLRRATAADVPVHVVVGSCALTQETLAEHQIKSFSLASQREELVAAGTSLASRIVTGEEAVFRGRCASELHGRLAGS